MEKIRSTALKIKDLVMRFDTIVVLVLLVLFAGVFATLSILPSGAADIELTTAESASSLRAIIDNPVDAPYKLLVYVATAISPSVRSVRFVSYIYLIGAAYSLFFVLKHWHRPQTATIAAAAFATNSVVLGIGRLGAPVITVFSWFIFIGLLLWQLHSSSKRILPAVAAAAFAALLYTPGALWFAIIVGIVYWDRMTKLIKKVDTRSLLIVAGVAAVVAMPLLVGFIRNPDILKQWLFLPETLDLNQTLRSALAVPSAFLYRMTAEPLVNVGRLPVFDIATGMLFLVGVFAYLRKYSLNRTRIMLGSVIVGMILGALGQTLTAVALLLPFAYSVIAAGVEYLLDEWKRVFPKNPFAFSFGIILISISLAVSSYYHLTRFLVVWPQTPETRQVYDNSRIID